MARPCPARLLAALLAGLLALAAAEGPCQEGLQDGSCVEEEEAEEATVSLLQTQLKLRPSAARAAPASTSASSAPAPAAPAQRDLVFMHMPFNFGHTVEKVAAFGSGRASMADFHRLLQVYGDFSGREPPRGVSEKLPPGSIAWGHISPMLQEVSNVTGCPMYYTPQKHWPAGLAERYFGSGKKIFGMLRDPYERLVAFFRGNMPSYGASYPEFFRTCDVNSAVKAMMRTYLAGGSEFANSCSFVPQAEYFDGPYGISLPVDNRQFPSSMNEVFREHGFTNLTIHEDDIFHVEGCSEVWAGDLDNETRALVKKVYKRDFELLCRHFGYCDEDESTCIWQVPQMCPQKVLASGYRGGYRGRGA